MKRILGFTDEFTTCDCCGKSNLKGTFCVEVDAGTFHFGSTCTFKKHGFDENEYKEFVKSAKKQNKLNAIAERDAAWSVYKKDGSAPAWEAYKRAIQKIQKKYSVKF